MIHQVAAGLEHYLTLLSVREKLTASNIANVDTPGYRTRDVDFQAELARAMSGSSPESHEVQGLYIKNDGNNVNLDRESRLLSETAMRFNVAANFVREQLSRVRMAISPEGGTQ